MDYAMTGAERLRDAIYNPYPPGAKEVRAEYMRKRLKAMGAG